MKWLILTDCERSDTTKAVVSFLSSNKCESEVIELSFGKMNSNINESMRTATHCIFLDLKKSNHMEALIYILGFLSGRGIPLFISGCDDCLPHAFLFDNCVSLGKNKSLLGTLEASFADYLIEEEIAEAQNKLVAMDVPLCADSFSEWVSRGDDKVVNLLLLAGLSVNAVTSKGISLLSVAVRNKNELLVKDLIKRGADINKVAKDRGYTPLMDAVWKRNLSLAKILLAEGAGLEAIAKDGQSVLTLAVGSEFIEMCELLFNAGADPFVKDAMGMSAYDYAKLFKKQKLVDLFEINKK